MIHKTELRDLLPGMVPFPTDVFPPTRPGSASTCCRC